MADDGAGRRAIRCSSFTEAGGHAANEDVLLVARHAADPHCWLCMLADGMGGQSGGGRAAAVACRTAMDEPLRTPPRRLSYPRSWVYLLRSADQAVYDDPAAGFCTLVGFAIMGGCIAGASCGDSAAAIAGPGLDFVELTAEQPRRPLAGSGDAAFRSFGAVLPAKAKAVAMTDGVWKYAGWERLRAAAERPGAELIDALKAGARLASGKFHDDFTVVVFEFEPGD